MFNSRKKRYSEAAIDFVKGFLARIRKREEKRSFSTGDLVDKPKIEESDYMEMCFYQKPTTSGLDQHFNDMDRVPMDFSGHHASLIPQTRKSARKMARSGSAEPLVNCTLADMVKSRPNYYPDIEESDISSILIKNGCEDGAFLFFGSNNHFAMAVYTEGKVIRYPLWSLQKDNERRIGLANSVRWFKDLDALVEHYSKKKSQILQIKLRNSCDRPLRFGTANRTRA